MVRGSWTAVNLSSYAVPVLDCAKSCGGRAAIFHLNRWAMTASGHHGTVRIGEHATSPAVAPSAIEAKTLRKVRGRINQFVFVLLVIASSTGSTLDFWICGIDHEQGVGYHEPTVQAAVGHILLWLFSFRDTKQPNAAQSISGQRQ